MAGILRYSTAPLVSRDIIGRPALVRLRLAAHAGGRPAGQGVRLVRQRVGLLGPSGRPGGAHRLALIDAHTRAAGHAPDGGVGGLLPPAVLQHAARELEEAALIDGANRFQTFWRVVLPLSRPALVTLGLLAFLTNYNDFLCGLLLFSPEPSRLEANAVASLIARLCRC